jgi:glutamate/tyrosine decarboxylase-like PLP-dependent enzyme
VPAVRPQFEGIESADSFVVDPHKWLFAPLHCAALLYRDPLLAAAAFIFPFSVAVGGALHWLLDALHVTLR